MMRVYKYSVHATVLAVISLFSFQVLIAQPFVDQIGVIPSNGFGNLVWGDYDNDGDLDYLITQFSSQGNYTTKIFRNNGNGAFSEQTGIVLPGISDSWVEWADIDSDGFLDIVLKGVISGGGKNITKIYRNTGANDFKELTGSSFVGSNDGSFDLGDYDNDGDLDLLYSIVNLGYNVKGANFYRNNGNSKFTKLSNGALAADFASAVFWGDFDNDGYLDVLFSMITTNGVSNTKIFHNNGNATFKVQPGAQFTSAEKYSIACADYDNDGYLDVLMVSEMKTKLYRNNGDGSFIEQLNVGLTDLRSGAVAWGDYNNDGYFDVLLSGQDTKFKLVTKLFRNNGNNSFSEQTDVSLLGLKNGSASFIDFDNDADLDIVVTGCSDEMGLKIESKLYLNNLIVSAPVPNMAPEAPNGLSASVNNGIATLKWDHVSTDSTKALSYNVRVGKTPGMGDIVSAHSSSTGFLLVPAMGNAQLNNFFILKNLPQGNYYFTVQSVDNGFSGGAFATEATFTVGDVEPVVNYIVSFNVDGGTSIADVKVPANAKIARPNSPIKSGHSFAGWYKEAACTNAWNFTTDLVTVPVTLFAKWNTVTGFERQQLSGIKKYPNPVSTSLNLSNLPLNAEIKILRIDGKLMREFSTITTESTIDVSSLPNGIYLLKVESEEKISVEKFIKQ